MFLHVQSIQTSKVDNPIFFKRFFFTKCAPFLLKSNMILTLMIRRAKGLKLLNYVFLTDLNTFGSKVFLTLKIMDFENVALTKFICM